MNQEQKSENDEIFKEVTESFEEIESEDCIVIEEMKIRYLKKIQFSKK